MSNLGLLRPNGWVDRWWWGVWWSIWGRAQVEEQVSWIGGVGKVEGICRVGGVGGIGHVWGIDKERRISKVGWIDRSDK